MRLGFQVYHIHILPMLVRLKRSSADGYKPARRVQRSFKVTEHDTIPYVRYGFLLVFCSNFVPKTYRFFRYSTSKNVTTLKSESDVWYHSIDWIWFPITVLVNLSERDIRDIHLRKMSWPWKLG